MDHKKEECKKEECKCDPKAESSILKRELIGYKKQYDDCLASLTRSTQLIKELTTTKQQLEGAMFALESIIKIKEDSDEKTKDTKGA